METILDHKSTHTSDLLLSHLLGHKAQKQQEEE